MYKQITRTLVGEAPGTLLHNERLANPLDGIAKEMKAITSKRVKTDHDYLLLSDLEWLGGLYTTEDFSVSVKGEQVKVEGGGRLCIPGENIEAMLVQAGAKFKMKEAFKAGIIAPGVFPLEYPGPKTIAELIRKPSFRDIRGVKVNKNRVQRTRPIVSSWRLPIIIQYLPEVLNESHIDSALHKASYLIGICDYRPKYGRFTVHSTN